MKNPIVVALVIQGNLTFVAFKKTGFRAPWASENPIDIEALVEHDQAIMEEWKRVRKAEKKAELEAKLKLVPVIQPYIESGQNESGIFRQLTEAQYAEAVMPPKLELAEELKQQAQVIETYEERLNALGDQAGENEQLQARIAELEAQLATQPPQESAPASTEEEVPPKKK